MTSPALITIWPIRCVPLAAIVAAYMEPPMPYTKRAAVRAAIEQRMERAVATGQGNRAARRAAAIETAAWHDLHASGITEADVDALAARYAEAQGARRLFPHATSFHD